MSVQHSVPQVSLPEGMIHLGLGQPGNDLLPETLLAQAAASALGGRTDGDSLPPDDGFFLAYGEEQGNADFRESLALFLSTHYPGPVEPDTLLITNGNSQALDFICTQFTKPGDTILVEEPTYFLAFRIFADHQLNIVSIPVDNAGLRVDCLEDVLKTMSPAFLYTIPTHHNPAGVTLSEQRRQDLVAVCKKNDLLVVADEVYHFLTFSKNLPTPMGVFCHQGPVVSLGSFSKILAPGLRLGWLQAGEDVIKKLTRAGVIVSGGGLNPFTSQIVHQLIQTGRLKDHIAQLNKVYSHRMSVLCDQLRKRLPDTVSFQTPEGGYFVWVQFPKGCDTGILREKALQQHINFFTGDMFSHDKKLKNYIRLAFCFYDEKMIIKGIKRLGHVVETWID